MSKTEELRKARPVSPKIARALRRLHKPGDCPAWSKYPLSKDKGDRPGTRIKDGEKWWPSPSPLHKPCTYCHKSKGCYEPWTPPGGNGGTTHDPDKTPLASFPKWPVAYMQEAQVGTDKIGKAVVMKRWEEVKAKGLRPMSRVFLDARAVTAVQWIAIAEAFVQEQIPSDPKRVKWIARLRRELVAHPMQVDCTVDCRSKYRHLWLIANAAQYLAGRFSGGVKVKPPYVAPPKSIVNQLADWAGNKITQAAGSQLGWWIGGGAVAGLGVLLVLKFGDRRKRR